jgi:hypothetical protein
VRRQRVRLVQFRHLRGHGEAFIKRKVLVLLAEQHFITALGVTGGGVADGARLASGEPMAISASSARIS